MFHSKRFFTGILIVMIAALSIHSIANAKPQFNAPRVPGEPGWAGRVFLRGEEKARKQAMPVLEREYRPLHVYGNMQRRHHYRDTVIPSQQDRRDKRNAFFNDHGVRNRYRS